MIRAMWEYRGQKRPSFAIEPGPGEESVWDYPRPPAVVPSEREVEVRSAGRVIARSTRALRVLETASPPTWYLPPDDVEAGALVDVPGSSFCEWKGAASYRALADDARARPVAWSYATPSRRFEALRGYVAFYPALLECLVDGERVRPQPGGFYGGWVTDEVIGPMKGEPGTGHW